MPDNTNRVAPRSFSTINQGQSVADIIESIQAYTQSLFAPLPDGRGSINNMGNTGNISNIGIDNTGFNWGGPQTANNDFMSGVLPAGQGVLQNMGDGNVAPTSPQTMGGGLNSLFPAPLQSSYVNTGGQQQQVPQGSQVNIQGGGNVGAPSTLQNILNNSSAQTGMSSGLKDMLSSTQTKVGIQGQMNLTPNAMAMNDMFGIENPEQLDVEPATEVGSDITPVQMFNMFQGVVGLGTSIYQGNKNNHFMEERIGIAKDKLGLAQKEARITNQRRGFV